MSEAVTLTKPDFVLELFERSRPRRLLGATSWVVAVGAHLLAAGLAFSEVRPAPEPLRAVEIELAPPPPPIVPEPQVPEPPPPAPVAAAEPAPAARALAAPPQPARAGALLTAKADPTPAPGADEPVDFTNDPTVVGFGSGVVAVGGRATHGVAQARLAPVAGTGSAPVGRAAAGDGLTPLSDLSRKPSLGESDPCRGYFPSGATDDSASAAVMVTIGKNGSVSSVRLLSETPPKQGFGAAARTCMSSKRFTPGLDRDGNPAATAVRVNVRFSR